MNASGDSVRITSEFTTTVTLNESITPGVVYIANTDPNLSGIDFMESLGFFNIPFCSVCNLVARSQLSQSDTTNQICDIISKFPTIFEDSLGHCTQAKATFTLKPSTKPVFQPKRPVSYAALLLVDQKIACLEKLNVITRVTYSKWAAPTVIVRKANGSIQLYADFSTGLSAALEDHHYSLPTPGLFQYNLPFWLYSNKL